MPTLTSSTEPVEEMNAAMAMHGYDVAEESETGTEPTPPSEQPDKPGVTPAAAPGGESAPASEAGTTQETQVEKPGEKPAVEAKPEEKPPSRGDFKSKLEKERQRVIRLTEDLDAERGSKAKIRADLEAAQARLAELTKAAEPAVKDEGPVKPKRPVRATFFAEDDPDGKYEAAMDAYEQQKDAYYAAVQEKTVTERLAAQEASRKEAEVKAAGERAYAEFEKRRDADTAQIEDYEDIFSQLTEEIQFPKDGVMELAVFEADRPGLLIDFFARDALNDGSKEMKRIAGLPQIRQAKELGRLEDRLVREHEARLHPPAAVAATPAPAVPEKQPEKPPAKPQPRDVPDEPIQPVTGRSRGTTPSLDQAKSPKEYLMLRNQGVTR